MPKPLSVIGVPSSAGAYAPGQEKTPAALREAGLLAMLKERGVTVRDCGDLPRFRWRPDKGNPSAMNLDTVVETARETARRVSKAMLDDTAVLVLGGDCTVGVGTVGGCAGAGGRVGLVYMDLDTDLNVPHSTTDGALDWMGVAHMLGVEGAANPLTRVGSRYPMLEPDSVLFFAYGNVTPWEQQVIDSMKIQGVPVDQVAADPGDAAHRVVIGWGKDFDRLLIHLDVDVIDFADFPIAEHTRRNEGLTFHQAMQAIEVLIGAENWSALTVAEVNPDHGAEDGSTVSAFATALADGLARSRVLT